MMAERHGSRQSGRADQVVNSPGEQTIRCPKTERSRHALTSDTNEASAGHKGSRRRGKKKGAGIKPAMVWMGKKEKRGWRRTNSQKGKNIERA